MAMPNLHTLWLRGCDRFEWWGLDSFFTVFIVHPDNRERLPGFNLDIRQTPLYG